MLTESTYKGLSGVRGNSHAPFLGGGGAAMCRCYPTRQTGQHCSSQNQSRKKKRIIVTVSFKPSFASLSCFRY